MNVFGEAPLARKLEQFEADTGAYGKFAEDLVGLAALASASGYNPVIDLGCRSGILAGKIFDSGYEGKVIAVGQDEPFLDLARLKFGQHPDPEGFLREIKGQGAYPKILTDNCRVEDLEKYLRTLMEKYDAFSERVEFHRESPENLGNVTGGEPVDAVLASHFIHWPRKKDAKPGEPNLEYEAMVLSAIRDALRYKGTFAFNTSGADYRFDDYDDVEHLTKHPFYEAFWESLNRQLGQKPAEVRKTFDYGEIERIMKNAGFELAGTHVTSIEYEAPRIIEVALFGGHMMLQKEGIEMPAGERDRILAEAVEYALSKANPEDQPVIENGINFLAVRR